MAIRNCTYCAAEFDPDAQSPFGAFTCSFHPMRPQTIGDTGPRGDHAEIWVFPCCGRRHVGEVVAGRDVVPPQSPGCINCFHAAARSTIFISYSRSDQKFVSFLEAEIQRRGYLVWKDTSHLLASDDWQSAIRSAIDMCTHVVLVVSRTAMSRPEVNREIGAAAQASKPIVPIVLDDGELPAWLQRLNYIDWQSNQEDAYSDRFGKLENALSDPTRMRFLNRSRLGLPSPGDAGHS